MDKRILVIDFDPVSAELTGALLATRGLPFALARSHAELEQALASGRPAMTILDPALPDEADGLRLCARLAEQFGPRGSVPIILVSRSLRGARWKSLARDSGAELFLERPSDDRLLLAAAERAVGAARAARPPAEPSSRADSRPVGATTTAGTRRTPPPPENDLENMVDEMFAQWFVERETGAAERPATTGAARTASPAGAVSTRGATGGAAVLEPPPEVVAPPPAPARSAPSRPVAPARPPGTLPSSELRRPAAARSTMTGPTGPTASAPAAPAAPVMPRAHAPLAATPDELQTAARSSTSGRTIAIAAAVLLIGAGIGFVALNRSGGAAESTEERPIRRPPARALAVPPSAADAAPVDPSENASTRVEAESGNTGNPVAVPPQRPAPAKAAVTPPAPEKVAERKPPPTPPPPPPPPAPSQPALADSGPREAPATAQATRAAEPEFVPTIAPSALPLSFDSEPDATLARLVAPQLIGSSRVDPAFPAVARQMKMSGQVRLRAQVRADGTVGRVTVLSEPTPNVGFGKAAEAAVRQWRYRPATLGSRAVDTEIDVVVNFSAD